MPKVVFKSIFLPYEKREKKGKFFYAVIKAQESFKISVLIKKRKGSNFSRQAFFTVSLYHTQF